MAKYPAPIFSSIDLAVVSGLVLVVLGIIFIAVVRLYDAYRALLRYLE